MTDAYSLFQRGRARLRDGSAEQAIAPLEQARTLEPGKASIREALGIAYYRSRRFEEAEAEFRQLVELQPTDQFAHEALGRTLRRLGRDSEAARYTALANAFRPRGEPGDGLGTA